MGEALHIYGISFKHLNLFLTEKMQSDRKIRLHVIDPHTKLSIVIYLYI